MKLNDRKITILQAIIHDYIQTAEPVGSRTLSKKYDLGISPATIRNEMSDLEELGFLKQPHTSAGRVPSDKAYRLYVDDLMEIKRITDYHRQQMKSDLLKKFGEVEQLLQYSSKIISQLTNYTSVVLAPHIKENRIKHIQLVPIDNESILAVMVTDMGIIKNPILRVNGRIDSYTLDRISNIINSKIQGKTIKEVESDIVKSIKFEINDFAELVEDIFPGIMSGLESDDGFELFMSGATNIFNFPEYNDLLKAKAFLKMLEEKQILSSLITSSNDSGLTISIGSENTCEEAKECSLVTATYKIDGNVIGWLSVIGPTRMDYSNVAGVMLQVSQYINDLLRKRYK